MKALAASRASSAMRVESVRMGKELAASVHATGTEEPPTRDAKPDKP